MLEAGNPFWKVEFNTRSLCTEAQVSYFMYEMACLQAADQPCYFHWQREHNQYESFQYSRYISGLYVMCREDSNHNFIVFHIFLTVFCERRLEPGFPAT